MPDATLGQRVLRLQALARAPWLRNTMGEHGCEFIDELVAVVTDLVTLATAPLAVVKPSPLPFAPRPRAGEGGPSCPATMADDAEHERRLQAFLDIPAVEP